MAGGIQPGMVAMDDHARKLDTSLKNISRSLVNEMRQLGYEYKSKLEQNQERLIGCEPDGGLWFKDGKLIAVFEAKKQGAGGMIWLVVAILWKEPALIVTNSVMSVTAILGFIWAYLK